MLYISTVFLTLLLGCQESEVNIVKNTSSIDGRIIMKNYTTNNVLDSSATFFGDMILEKIVYKSGVIRDYFFYNANKEICYYRSYNENGEFVLSEGTPCFYGVSKNFSINVDNPYTTEDTLITYFFAPNPPKCSTVFYINVTDSLYPFVHKMKDVNCGHIAVNNPLKKGLWEYCFTMKFFDSISNYSTRKDKCITFEVVDAR